MDRRRLRVVYAAEGEQKRLAAAMDRFQAQVGALEQALAAQVPLGDPVCETAPLRSDE